MNTSLRALIWESWLRNRWGFGLIAVLFVLCQLLRLGVSRMESHEGLLRASFRDQTRGTIAVAELLPRTEGPIGPARGSVEVGRTKYDGAFAPGDQLAWQAELTEQGVPLLSATFRGAALCVAEPLPPRLVVKAKKGETRTISFLANLDLAERVARARARADSGRVLVLGTSLAGMAFSILAIFAAFGSAEPHQARGFTGLPPRQFTLPVATAALVGVPVVLGALTMLAVAMAWTRGLVAPLSASGKIIPHGHLAGVLAAGLAVFQALVWGLASFPKWRITLVTASVVSILLTAVTLLAGFRGIPDALTSLGAPISFILLVIWCAAVATGWAGVVLERRGHWAGWERRSILSNAFAKWGPRPEPFLSAGRAQLWMEWRRNARSALGVWTAMVWVALICHLWVRTEPTSDFQSLADGLSILGPVAALAWVVVAGLNMARDGASKRLAFSSFTAVRPVTSGELFQAKLTVGAMLWLGALLILAASAGLAFAVGGFPAELDEWDEWLGLFRLALVLAMVSLHLFVGILPLCLTGRLPGFPWSLLPLLLVYGLAIHGILWWEKLKPHTELMAGFLGALVVIKLTAAFWGFRRSIALRLSSFRFAGGCALAWLIAAAFLLRLVIGDGSLGNPLEDELPLTLAGLLLIPLARIAISPLALAGNRHR